MLRGREMKDEGENEEILENEILIEEVEQEVSNVKEEPEDVEEMEEITEEGKSEENIEKSEEFVLEKNEEVEGTVEEEGKSEEDSKKYKVLEENVKKKKTVSIKVAAISISVVILVIVLFSTVFSLVNLGNTKIVDGVSINGVQLVGFSREDAKLEVDEVVKTQLEKNIVLVYSQFETSLIPEQIEVKYNVDKAIDEAYGIGRSSNIIKNNFDILYAMLFGKEISIEISYNDKALTEMIVDTSKKIPGSIKETNYYIENEDKILVITKGTPGISVKVEETKKMILDQIMNFKLGYIELPVENKQPSQISMDKIYQEVYKEPKNAYFQENPYKIYPHEDGVDFDISLEEARLLLQEDKEEYEVPLRFTAPEIPTHKLGAEAFPHKLTAFSTRYDALNINRTTNLVLASDKINGYVLLPGEEFSYNRVVGERTIRAGYKEAAMYSGGEVVDGLGGGICQISSTLYNIVVQANLEIVERSNHQFLTSYVGAGKDATVVYGAIDFKFKNTRNYPVRIVSSVKNGVAQMELYGVKEELEYDVKIETDIINTIPYSTRYVEDGTLDSGVEKTKQNGAQGCKSIAYKVTRLNGVVVSREVLSNDTYSAITKIVRRGTKGAQPVQQTQPPTQNQATPQTPAVTTNTTTDGKPVTTITP